MQVHDKRFFFRVMAVGTLGFGESYMDGWWECETLTAPGPNLQITTPNVSGG